MTNQQSLKDQLMLIIEQENFEAHKHLVFDVLNQLGSLDPVLRDDLGFTFLAHVISTCDLSIETLYQIVELCIEKLTLNVSKINNDVFMRSFSMLVLCVLIDRHIDSPYLSKQLEQTITEQSIEAFSQEIDSRGFIEPYGWAHAFAHGADLFAHIAHLDTVTYNQLISMLYIIKDKILMTQSEMIYGEDKRFARAVLEIFNHELIGLSEKKSFLESFFNHSLKGHHKIILMTRLRGFLTALWVGSQQEDIKPYILEFLIQAVKT